MCSYVTSFSRADDLLVLRQISPALTVLTKLIYSVIALQIILCVIDGFPFTLTLMGVASHLIYLGNMRRFPFVKLSDPLFIASCGMLLLWI